MIILDTDIMTLIEWQGTSTTQKLRKRFAQFEPGEIRPSIVSFAEQMRGWITYIKKADLITKEIDAYRRMERQLRMYAEHIIVEFDETAATEFQKLRKQFRRLKENDLKIAAITLTNNATLVSRNLQDFKQIPGLKVEDWTKE